ncbi:MAG TPA: PH domain-containing protein [Acidimicrobiales bacterium]|nr:PH domain-containing protein [Acidimicrobiales bacterium]
MSGPFAPPLEHSWTRVSPRLVLMRRAELVAFGVPVAAGIAVGFSFVTTLAGVAAGIVALAIGVLAWFSIRRNWRSWGYVERVDDLLVTHGAMFKKLTVVPYGRMQLVDVEAGPVERLFGLVRVKLHTAAASTDAEVCGLTPDLAGALRDQLTALGEAHAAGL